MTVRSLFEAKGQIALGVLLLVATVAQTIWWLIIQPPSVKAVFIVSMEALLFAALNQIGSGLGYRKTEHVEAKVVESVDADSVNAEHVGAVAADNVHT